LEREKNLKINKISNTEHKHQIKKNENDFYNKYEDERSPKIKFCETFKKKYKKILIEKFLENKNHGIQEEYEIKEKEYFWGNIEPKSEKEGFHMKSRLKIYSKNDDYNFTTFKENLLDLNKKNITLPSNNNLDSNEKDEYEKFLKNINSKKIENVNYVEKNNRLNLKIFEEEIYSHSNNHYDRLNNTDNLCNSKKHFLKDVFGNDTNNENIRIMRKTTQSKHQIPKINLNEFSNSRILGNLNRNIFNVKNINDEKFKILEVPDSNKTDRTKNDLLKNIEKENLKKNLEKFDTSLKKIKCVNMDDKELILNNLKSSLNISSSDSYIDPRKINIYENSDFEEEKEGQKILNEIEIDDVKLSKQPDDPINRKGNKSNREAFFIKNKDDKSKLLEHPHININKDLNEKDQFTNLKFSDEINKFLFINSKNIKSKIFCKIDCNESYEKVNSSNATIDLNNLKGDFNIINKSKYHQEENLIDNTFIYDQTNIKSIIQGLDSRILNSAFIEKKKEKSDFEKYSNKDFNKIQNDFVYDDKMKQANSIKSSYNKNNDCSKIINDTYIIHLVNDDENWEEDIDKEEINILKKENKEEKRFYKLENLEDISKKITFNGKDDLKDNNLEEIKNKESRKNKKKILNKFLIDANKKIEQAKNKKNNYKNSKSRINNDQKKIPSNISFEDIFQKKKPIDQNESNKKNISNNELNRNSENSNKNSRNFVNQINNHLNNEYASLNNNIYNNPNNNNVNENNSNNNKNSNLKFSSLENQPCYTENNMSNLNNISLNNSLFWDQNNIKILQLLQNFAQNQNYNCYNNNNLNNFSFLNNNNFNNNNINNINNMINNIFENPQNINSKNKLTQNLITQNNISNLLQKIYQGPPKDFLNIKNFQNVSYNNHSNFHNNMNNSLIMAINMINNNKNINNTQNMINMNPNLTNNNFMNSNNTTFHNNHNTNNIYNNLRILEIINSLKNENCNQNNFSYNNLLNNISNNLNYNNNNQNQYNLLNNKDLAYLNINNNLFSSNLQGYLINQIKENHLNNLQSNLFYINNSSNNLMNKNQNIISNSQENKIDKRKTNYTNYGKGEANKENIREKEDDSINNIENIKEEVKNSNKIKISSLLSSDKKKFHKTEYVNLKTSQFDGK